MSKQYALATIVVNLDNLMNNARKTFNDALNLEVGYTLKPAGMHLDTILEVASTTSDWRPDEYRVKVLACVYDEAATRRYDNRGVSSVMLMTDEQVANIRTLAAAG